MEIPLNSSYQGLTNQSRLSRQRSVDLNAIQDKKKGITLFNIPHEQEQKYLNYKPKKQFIDWPSLIKQPDFNIKCYKESTYMGTLDKLSKRSGKGVITYNSGRLYEGQWLDDKRHGFGYEQFMNGNSYEGEYRGGKVCGQGIYKWANGEFYEGQWLDGLKSGYGLWQGKDQYIGEWVDNQPNGFGKHVWSNGDYYEGEWKYCLRHGKGTDFFSIGDEYVGEYVLGKAEGFGQYKWKNGNLYSGQFFNGVKSGQGSWKKSGRDNDNKYSGSYKNDMKHGHGEFVWASGSRYRGNYDMDMKTGYGEMFWSDGSIYRGFWNQGNQDGIGLMIFRDGMRKAGFFSSNIYKAPLLDLESFSEWEKANSYKIPEAFRQEIKEYIGQLNEQDNYDGFIGQEFVAQEIEDFTAKNALKDMQDMANAPWAQNGMTKEEYAQSILEMEQAAKKHDNDPEPTKLQKTQSEAPYKLMFHDFEYITPLNFTREGSVEITPSILKRGSIRQKSIKSSVRKSRKSKSPKKRKASKISLGKDPSISIYNASQHSKKKFEKLQKQPRRNIAPLRALSKINPASQANSKQTLPAISTSVRKLSKIKSQKPTYSPPRAYVLPKKSPKDIKKLEQGFNLDFNSIMAPKAVLQKRYKTHLKKSKSKKRNQVRDLLSFRLDDSTFSSRSPSVSASKSIIRNGVLLKTARRPNPHLKPLVFRPRQWIPGGNPNGQYQEKIGIFSGREKNRGMEAFSRKFSSSASPVQRTYY